MVDIGLANSDQEIIECFPVMHQLRPHLIEQEFLPRVRRQQKEGYSLAYLRADSRIESLAGFRISESLYHGRFLYIDDLITNEVSRSHGFGSQIFDWVVKFAKTQGCDALALDSGVQRFGAHRFYLQKRMDIACHHFAMKLK